MISKLEKRAAIIKLYTSGKKATDIYKLLNQAGINKWLILRTIKRFNELGSIEDREKSGRKRSVRTRKMIKNLRQRLLRNPLQKLKKLAKELNSSKSTVQRAIKNDLKLKAYKRYTCHSLNNGQKLRRAARCKQLLKRHTDEEVKSILFTDEKLFTVETSFNRQNDRIYLKERSVDYKKIARVIRGHHPQQIMVWTGVSGKGKTPLYFVDQGVKVRAKNYLEDILESIVKPLNISLFKNEKWTFQQDSAPAHKAKIVQSWLSKEVPDFISTSEWPAASPDLNPMDYSIWSILESMACSKPHKNLDDLKRSLIKAWDELPMTAVCASVSSWKKRLRACVAAKGDYFENFLKK